MYSKYFLRWLSTYIVLSAVVIITLLMIKTIILMSTTSDIEALDKKIRITDIVAVVALVITLIGAIMSLYFKSQMNELLKSQREKDQLRIAQATEQSESAKKDASLANEKAAKSNERAANAELKSKQTEVELLSLRLAVGDRFIPENIKESLTPKLKAIPHKNVVIFCEIANSNEPIYFCNELNDFFKSIDWNSEVKNQNNLIIPAPTGFTIIASGDENKHIAKLLHQQFSVLNYKCNVQVNTTGQYDLVIQVGGK